MQDQRQMIEGHHATLPDTAHYPLKVMEESQSAYRPGRPTFNQIMTMADKGEVRGIIVVHPNRISRNHADSGAFVQRLVDGGIQAMDITDGKRYTGADSNTIFMLTLENAMSWKDSRDKGDRILKAMEMRSAEGKHMGPVGPGYNNIKLPDGTPVLEVDPERAPHILRLFQLVISGSYSLRDLVKEAKRIGLRSKRNNVLGVTAINNILHDPIYKGCVRFNNKISKGRHKAIVPEDLWNRTQLVLAGRNSNAARPKIPTLRELFHYANVLRCPLCGRSLCSYRAKGKYIYYECKNSETKCGVIISQNEVEAQLHGILSEVTLSQSDLGNLRERLLKIHEEKSENEIERRESLQAEYAKVQQEIGSLFRQRDKAVEMGMADAVDVQLSQLKARRDELQAATNQLHDRGTAWIEKVIRSFELMDLLREAFLYGSPKIRQAILNSFASNYSVQAKILSWQPRAPFRQAEKKAVCFEWWAGLVVKLIRQRR